MVEKDRLAVATFILLLLGASFLVLLVEFATAYVLPAAAIYLLLGAFLLYRVLTKG